MQCDLFNVTRDCLDKLGKGGRQASEAEAKAYADFLRRRRDLPDLGHCYLHHVSTGGGRRGGFVYRGATFGQQTANAQSIAREGGGWELVPAQYENGAFSVIFPGHDLHRARVTLETLGDDGEVIAAQTLPVEPKKGGVIWSREDVRKAAGPVEKAGKRKAAPVEAPIPVAQEVAPIVEIWPEEPQERAEAVEATHAAPEPVEALCEAVAAPVMATEPARPTRGARGRANRAIAMLTGDKPGMGRRALDNCFEEGDGGAVASIISERLTADPELARRVFYGRRQYRASYPGDYPETAYASHFLIPEWFAIIVRHGIATLDAISNTYGMRDKVAAILAADAPAVDQEAEAPICADPSAETAPQSNVDQEPAADPIAELLARVEALEVRVDSLPVDLAPPIADAARPKRTVAHERAIRRAWAERRAARLQGSIAADHLRMREAVEAERDTAATCARVAEAREQAMRAKLQEAERARDALRADCHEWEALQHRTWGEAMGFKMKRRAGVIRARRMIEASRADTRGAQGRADMAQAELARLKRDMADPSQPERASDIRRLIEERDAARTAAAATDARNRALQSAVDTLAPKFEAMVSRVSRAEAAMRAAGLTVAA